MKTPIAVFLVVSLFACGSSDSRTASGGTAGRSSNNGGSASTGGGTGTAVNTGGSPSTTVAAGMGGATGGASTGGSSTGGTPAAGGTGGTPIDTVPGVLEAVLNSQKTVFGSILGSRSDSVDRFKFSVSGSIKKPFTRTFSLSIDIPRGVESGTFSCVTKPTGTFAMAYLAEDGLYVADPKGTCSVTMSKIPGSGSGRLVGTFDGVLIGPTPIVVAAGVIDVPVQ